MYIKYIHIYIYIYTNTYNKKLRRNGKMLLHTKTITRNNTG